jgi:tetratricopeptide (TPR) repeat protein
MARDGRQEAPPGPGPLTRAERRAYDLGRRCYERGDEETALSAFGRLLETRRGFADVHYMMGTLFERRNDLAAATESLREAVRLNPSYLEALLALAMIHERQGEYERSRELTDRAREQAGPAQGSLDPTTRGKLANLQAELGDAFREAGELGDAIEAYRRALDRCPGFHDIRYRLGIALREAGLPARAMAEFERVRRGSPGFVDASVQLGLTLYSLGRTRDAVERWRAVLRADPSRSDARMYLRLVKAPGEAPGIPTGDPD